MRPQRLASGALADVDIALEVGDFTQIKSPRRVNAMQYWVGLPKIFADPEAQRVCLQVSAQSGGSARSSLFSNLQCQSRIYNQGMKIAWLISVLFCAFASGVASAQVPKVEASDKVAQGNTLRIRVYAAGVQDSGRNWSATLAERKIALYADEPGTLIGLMPVAATQQPGEFALEIFDAAGKSVHRRRVEVEDAKFRIQNIQATKAMKALTPSPGEMEAIRGLQALVSHRRWWVEPLVRPTPHCVNSPFGVQRYHNGVATGNYHRGVDHRSPAGTPVRATAAGIVQISRMFRLHGGTVGIDHGQGVSSVYVHLRDTLVTEGASVAKGDLLGHVGATGFATGPHLHWGLYVNGLPVNPLQWIPELSPCR